MAGLPELHRGFAPYTRRMPAESLDCDSAGFLFERGGVNEQH
jgi:hypothetical protein